MHIHCFTLNTLEIVRPLLSLLLLLLHLLLSTKVNEEPQSEKVDELSATEKAEAHAKANNATKDANELLPAKVLRFCELGHSVAVKIYVKVGHLSNLVPHCPLCTVHLPWVRAALGRPQNCPVPACLVPRLECVIKILPELHEEWSSFMILLLEEVVHEELCIINKVCGRHLKVLHSHWSDHQQVLA